MKKHLLVSLAAIFSSAILFAQVEKKIEEAMKDPKAAENAAKADALLIDKTKIKDSTTCDKIISDKPAKKKERSCLFKRKKKQGKRSS